MATILVKAEDLAVGDVLCLPFNKTATIKRVGPVGPRTRYVRLTTENGATRIEVGQKVSVEARVL